jgi:hypothetical protein
MLSVLSMAHYVEEANAAFDALASHEQCGKIIKVIPRVVDDDAAGDRRLCGGGGMGDLPSGFFWR